MSIINFDVRAPHADLAHSAAHIRDSYSDLVERFGSGPQVMTRKGHSRTDIKLRSKGYATAGVEGICAFSSHSDDGSFFRALAPLHRLHRGA